MSIKRKLNPNADDNVTRKALQDLEFNTERIEYSEVNLANPAVPTDAELDAEFGTPAQRGAGFTALIDENGADTNGLIVGTNGTSWFFVTLTKAT